MSITTETKVYNHLLKYGQIEKSKYEKHANKIYWYEQQCEAWLSEFGAKLEHCRIISNNINENLTIFGAF
jgi:hypothetical protein